MNIYLLINNIKMKKILKILNLVQMIVYIILLFIYLIYSFQILMLISTPGLILNLVISETLLGEHLISTILV